MASTGKVGRILSIANQKGGVGKTTTAISLSAALRRENKRILLLDLDPHANASVHLRYYEEELTHTINDIFCDDIFRHDASVLASLWEQVRHQNEQQEIDVVPATIQLAELELELRTRENKGFILQHALQRIRYEYDYIILDCPPHVGVLLVNALVAADLLIIPIQTDYLALHGLKLLFDTLRVINKVLPQSISYKVLATLHDKRARACCHILELLRSKMGEHMFSTVIGMDTRFREASAQGLTIFDIAANSRGALAYTELAREILAYENT